MSDPSLGSTIRAARLATGGENSLRAYARILEISPSYLSDIERDLRVPSEHRTEVIASVFGLDFDRLMALSGRLGSQADRYLRRNPLACILMRRIVDFGLDVNELKALIMQVDSLVDARTSPAIHPKSKGAPS